MALSSRRQFVQMLSVSGLGTLWLKNNPFLLAEKQFPISCSSYNWTTFFKREGLRWGENPEFDIAQFAKSGIKALEQSFESPEHVETLMPYLEKYEISMPSAYVNSILHEPDKADGSIDQILKIAKALKAANTKILVTNPTPIAWGKQIPKTDAQIRLQTENLNLLGSELRDMGIQLAYHTHDSEMAAGATEFHHVLQNTDPQFVWFCLDAHWIYRGCNDSQLAVFDAIKMYGDRIAELHIRQSEKGTWTETFGKGDIDYSLMASIFGDKKIRPHLVIEQCIEQATPHTMDSVAAHREDLKNVEKIFHDIL